VRETAFGILTAIAAICFLGALLQDRYGFRATCACLLTCLVAGAIAASLVQ
jgi:hypothetical protein